MMNKKAREMGLGPLHTVSLAEARDAALACRKLVRDGVDPIEARKAAKNKLHLDEASLITFKECADAYIRAHRPGWRNAKHAAQWETTLETYAHPKIGHIAVKDIDTNHVMSILDPIWLTKNETASRVRGRIESILDWASSRKYREGDNSATWKGNLKNLLPARSKVAKPKHHAALPYQEVGSFVSDLRQQEGTAARGLELLVLTALRTGEVIGATWDEIKLEDKVWEIPGERMKMGQSHRVPLSPPAIGLLKGMQKNAEGIFVVPGARSGRPLSSMAFLQLLKRMGRNDLTAHGFRSTFRDWSAEKTTFPREVAEMALAHTIGDKVEAAYRRGDLFDKRRKLMDAWAKHCEMAGFPSESNVVVMAKS